MTTQPFAIQRATASDAPAISQLIGGLSRYFTLDPQGAGAEDFLQTINPTSIQTLIEAPGMAYYKATQGEQLVGVVALRDNAHLYHLFVVPTVQGQGLGRRMWEHVLGEARLRGNAGQFTVNSTPHAVPVYERFGFKATGPRVEMRGIAFVPMQYPSPPH